MKKAETRKVRKVVKPLGDDDLFGDSGDIFSDIPSKPKGAKKKKSATTAPKDDIFAEEAAAGGSWCFFCFFFCSCCFIFGLFTLFTALLMFCAAEQTKIVCLKASYRFMVR